MGVRPARRIVCAAAALLLAPFRLLVAQCPNGTPPPCAGARPAADAHSVAVLPFENRARDSTLVLLAEGLADEITTNLARIGRLQVSSPAAVRLALGRGPRDLRRLGGTLGARWLVDGQLLSAGGKVRVIVHLVEAVRGTNRM
jgi:adenylate cyclase